MTNKNLYKIDYALLSGETMSYGYVIYTHAYSEQQALTQLVNRLGREYKRAREIRINPIERASS